MTVLVALGACGSLTAAPPPPRPVQAPVRPEIQLHMFEADQGAHRLQSMLLHGDLTGARDLALAYSEAPDEPALAPWSAYAASVRIQAKRLAQVDDARAGMRELAMLGATCGSCHQAAHATVHVAPPPALPEDTDEVAARMARHRWATDELWSSLVARDSKRWRSGMLRLAEEPFMWDDMALAQRRDTGEVQRIARESAAIGDALDPNGPAVQAYGNLLAVCVDCHASSDQHRR